MNLSLPSIFLKSSFENLTTSLRLVLKSSYLLFGINTLFDNFCDKLFSKSFSKKAKKFLNAIFFSTFSNVALFRESVI